LTNRSRGLSIVKSGSTASTQLQGARTKGNGPRCYDRNLLARMNKRSDII
jgi:hypothetical protein